MIEPRGVRPEEIESLHTLTDIVFRPGMAKQYPQLFNADNYENLRVCVVDGKCVSHVGMKIQDAFLYGCRIRTVCIGGVATHPDYRKLGYASLCFDDARRISKEQGVDVMIVSGDRNLYRMRGCLHVGDDRVFSITPHTLPPELEARSASITVSPMAPAELPLVMECYQKEPVRFQRFPSDYHYLHQSGWAMNSPVELWVVRERGDFRGYLLIRKPTPQSEANLVEFAGDRASLLSALPLLMRHYALNRLSFQVQRHDSLLRSLCEAYGWEGTLRSTSGTVTLIHFSQLMERMRPRFEEILGQPLAASLRFSQNEEAYTFGLGTEEFVTDRDTATRMLFGTTSGVEPALAELGGALGEALRSILPLPTLWYGINYV